MKRMSAVAAWLGMIWLVSPAIGQTLELGSPAPTLEGLKWIKGKPIDLGKVKGRQITVIEFWATWCPPCIPAIAHLSDLQHRYADKNVRIVGVTEHEDNNTLEIVQKFTEQWGDKMDYAVAFDTKGEVVRRYMVASGQEFIPAVFIVDKSGTIAWIGPPDDTLDDALAKIVAGEYDIQRAKKLAKIDKRIEQAAVLGDWERVIKGTDESLALDPANAGRWMGKFFVYVHYLGKLDEAKRTAREALAHTREHPVKMAEIAVQLVLPDDGYGCNDLAMKALAGAVKDAPEIADIRVAYFQALSTVGKHSEAEAVAATAVELMKSDAGKLNAFARLLSTPERRERNGGLALKAIDLALRTDADEPTHYLTKFNILYDCRNDIQAANATGRLLIQKAGGDADFLNGFAWSLLMDEGRKGKFNQLALAAAEKMIKAPGGDGWSQLETLALAKFETGAVGDAIGLQKRALAGCPNEFAKANMNEALQRYEAAAKKQ